MKYKDEKITAILNTTVYNFTQLNLICFLYYFRNFDTFDMYFDTQMTIDTFDMYFETQMTIDTFDIYLEPK